MTQQFVEVIIAPEVSADAQAVLADKTNVRVLDGAARDRRRTAYDFKRVGGGLLVQTPDAANVGAAELKVVTRNAPTAAQLRRPRLRVARGEIRQIERDRVLRRRPDPRRRGRADEPRRQRPHRLDQGAATRASRLTGSVVASDAFFPFRDGVDVVAEAGATAIIQPGGSVRDEEVIAAADEHGIAMVFTGLRHFRH